MPLKKPKFLNPAREIILYVIGGLLISISMIYLISAIQETPQSLDKIAKEGKETIKMQKNENEKTEHSQFAKDVISSQVQTVFFSIAGTSNFVVGLWILRSKQDSKIPYLVATIGSSLLVILYLASRTTDLPIVGLQGDVGPIDILSKIMQGFVVAGSMYLLKTGKNQVNSKIMS